MYQIWTDTSQADTTRSDALSSYIYQGYFNSQPDSAILLATELVDFTKSTGNGIGSVDALNLLGYIHFRMGNYPESLAAYDSGLTIADSIGDRNGRAQILNRKGFIYHDNDDMITALKLYEESLEIYKEVGDLDGVGSIYNEFGSIYRVKKEYDKALEYYARGIEINQEQGEEDQNTAIYANMGSLYLDKGELDTALNYIQKALTIDRQKGNKLGIANGLASLGSITMEKGDPVRATELLLQSLSISEEIEHAQGASLSYLSLGDIEAASGRFINAVKYCKKSLEISVRLGDVGNQMDACDCLYDAYKSLGRISDALESLELVQIFYDSIQTEETAMKLQQMEFSKQVVMDSLAQVEREMELELAHQIEVRQKDRNRNLALGTGLFFLLLAGGFFSRWRYVKKSNAVIEKERDRSNNLLLNILPAEIAEELKEKGEAVARDFDLVSILFTDFKGFTEKSESLSASELIGEINHCYKKFDLICEKYKIEKIKTIGDSYMAAGGLPMPSPESVSNTVLAGIEMQSFMGERLANRQSKDAVVFEMRLGIHTGPVVAGIVGIKKFQYDVWGDTVNTASRMESNGVVGKVNISEDTYNLIKDNTHFSFVRRGAIQVKGKGEMDMWFVSKAPRTNSH